MSDESPGNDQVWWMPADQPDRTDLAEPPARPGWIHSTRPIGPMGLPSGSRRPYIIAGVVVAALLGGAGAALAATDSPLPAASSSAAVTNPSSSPAPPGAAPPGAPAFRHLGRGPGFGANLFGMFGALHGQFVVAKSGGGYQTIDVQSGQVTAVSSTSITIKSADGFTKSYPVASSTLVDAQRDGIGSVKVGHEVSAQATVSGRTVTAIGIEDLTLLQQSRPAFGLVPSGGGRPQAG
jgi:hypothetical protein